MSVKQTYVVVCDNCGYTRFHLAQAQEIPRRAHEVRALAKDAGWLYQPVPPGTPSSYSGPVAPNDYCPRCAANRAEAQP